MRGLAFASRWSPRGPGRGAKMGDQEERSVSWNDYEHHNQASTEANA